MKSISLSILLLCGVAFLNTTTAQTVPIKRLSVGDTIPNLELDRIVNYKSESAHIYDFKKKLLIIDFWATWCAPCVKMIDKADSLQTQYSKDLVFLPVTDESKSKVETFLTNRKELKRQTNFFSVVEDRMLNKLFLHTSLPTYVWINQNGVVVAITDQNEITSEKIATFLSGKNTTFRAKDVNTKEVDLHKRLFVEEFNYFSLVDSTIHIDSINSNDLLFHSVFTKHIDGLHGEVRNDKHKFSATNVAIPFLLKYFFGCKSGGNGLDFFDGGRTIYQIKDTSLLNRITGGKLVDLHNSYLWRQWGLKNAISYECICPVNTSFNQRNKIIEDDLHNYLAALYKITFEIDTISRQVMVLKSIGDLSSIKTRGGERVVDRSAYSINITNGTINDFIGDLAYFYQGGNLSLDNETGFDANIDIKINGDFRNLTSLNKALFSDNLKFDLETRKVPILVIKDL